MRATTFVKALAVTTLLPWLLAAGSAFADRDGKDGGGRGGDGRSFDGGSSRSFDGGGSSRSVIRSQDSSRSYRSSDGDRPSSRTFRDSGDSGNRSIRSTDSSRNFQGTQKYEARRPSGDQVRDFLKQGDNTGRTRDRSPQDRELVDREFKQWHTTWNGQKGDGRDHRDWSGNWRDSDRFTTADRIRRDWNGRRDNDRVFGGDWWRERHRGNYWDFWGDYGRRYNRPWYWWSWATGPRLASWIVFGWPTPYYWDYGPGEYITYDNGAIYVNGRWYEPAPVYYDQTVRLVDQAPELTAESAAKLEWMPLGVFAATPDGVAEAQVTMQLAVTKDGVIGGTAFDQKSGAAFNIRGMVDKRSQRAVWSYTDDRNKRIMMETSIYNLTQPEATGLVHYGPTDMRVVELVRLQEPGSGTAAQGSATSTLPAPSAAR